MARRQELATTVPSCAAQGKQVQRRQLGRLRDLERVTLAALEVCRFFVLTRAALPLAYSTTMVIFTVVTRPRRSVTRALMTWEPRDNVLIIEAPVPSAPSTVDDHAILVLMSVPL